MGIQFMAIVPQVADIAFAAIHTQAVASAADHTWATIAFIVNRTQAVPFAADHTQAVTMMTTGHIQVVVALITNHTLAIVAFIVIVGIFDPTQAGMVRKAIVAIEVNQTNEDDRAQQAQILTNQSLDWDKQAASMQDHSKNLVDTKAIL